jgi:hypothetical protein
MVSMVLRVARGSRLLRSPACILGRRAAILFREVYARTLL